VGEANTPSLNRLERELPEGLLVDSAWLEREGFYGSLRTKYLNHGWLERPVRGVYRRPRGELTWEQAVVSLQLLLERPIVVGGRTALRLQGFDHYVSMSEPQYVHLYGEEAPPSWLFKLPVKNRFVFHNARTLFENEPITRSLAALSFDVRNGGFAGANHEGLRQMPWGQWNWPLTLSTPERALLEALDELPSHESFHQVDMLFEGATQLSPRRLRVLLESCRSVKVKRLFFWFADRHDHAWRRRLDPTELDLGSGKRMLVRGGRLDPTYRITVPREPLDQVPDDG
jgi:hypothetical protein